MLRFERDAWSMVKRREASVKRVRPPPPPKPLAVYYKPCTPTQSIVLYVYTLISSPLDVRASLGLRVGLGPGTRYIGIL